MADITATASHSVEPAVMRERLTALAEKLSAKYGIQYRWEGDTCLLKGGALKNGSLEMCEAAIKLELNLGLMAKMFKAQIEKEIERQVQKLTQS